MGIRNLRCLTKCRNQSLIKIALPKWSPHEYLCRTMKKDFMRRILNVLVISFPQKLDICQLRHFGNIVKLIWIVIIRLPASPNCQKSRYKSRKPNFEEKNISELKLRNKKWRTELDGLKLKVALRNFYKRRRPVFGREPLVMKNLIGEKVRFALDFVFCLYFSWFSSIACTDGNVIFKTAWNVLWQSDFDLFSWLTD